MRLENLSSAAAEAIIQKKRMFFGRIAIFLCCPLLTFEADVVRIFGLYCAMNILMTIRSLRRNVLPGEEELQATPFSDVPPHLKTAKLTLLFYDRPAGDSLFDMPILSIFGLQYCFLGAVIELFGSVVDTSLTEQAPSDAIIWLMRSGFPIFSMLAKFMMQKDFIERGLKNLNAEDQHLARTCLYKEASLRVSSAAFFNALVSPPICCVGPAEFMAAIHARFL